MSDKYLTVKEWEKFSKGKGYKDAALLKALAAAEKAADDEPQAQLKVLFELEEVGQALYRQHKGDKKLESYLEDVYKALKKYRHDAEKRVDKAAKRDEKEGNDNDSPVLLQGKMIPLLRQVRKGAVMHALIGLVDKNAAVLLQKNAIAPGRRELLQKWLGATSGVKYVPGECIWENEMHTFVVQSAAAGLAKKLKAALLAQTELRLKVRVRGIDPNDVDEDASDAEELGEGDGELDEVEGEDTGDDGQGEGGGGGTVSPEDEARQKFEALLAELEPKALAALQAQHPESTKIRAVGAFAREKGEAGNYAAGLAALAQWAKLIDSGAGGTAPSPQPSAPPPPPPGVDPAAAFNARLAALMPRVKDALAAGGDAATTLKLKVSEAGMFARKKEFDSAQSGLDEVERLLGADAGGGRGGGDSGGAPVQPPSAPTPSAGGKVAFTQARLQWDSMRKRMQTELKKLEAEVLAKCQDETDFITIASNIKDVYSVLEFLDERLIDKLDDILNAADADQRTQLQIEAREIVSEYADYVKTDEMLQAIDDNGFVVMGLVPALNQCLQGIDQQLRAAVAA